MKVATLLLGAVVLVASSVRAGNPVSDVSFSADETRAVIRYSLANDAIVTGEIVTNGVPVAAADFSSATGDINRLVSAGTRRIEWVLPSGLTRKTLRNAEAVLTAWSTNAPPKYLVVDLIASNTAYYASAEALPAGGLTNDLYRTSKMVFVRIPAGGRTFSMGSPAAVHGSLGTEVGHEVTLTQDYWMGVFELTQKQYENVMGDNPSVWTGSVDSPVQPFDRSSFSLIRGNGNWPTVKTVDANSLCGRLRQFTGIPTFDIPTDAQWEFACKADGSMEAPNGAVYDSNGGYLYGNIDDYAWTVHNSKIATVAQPHRVGEKLPNAFGLYDMLGNIWEWVLDYLNSNDTEAVIDPVGATTGNDGKRLRRGGNYNSGMDSARASYRSMAYYPGMTFDDKGNFGVRLVCTFRPKYTPVVPEGTGVRWVRDEQNGLVTVAYDLDKDAIVTTDILTNGVSIGVERFLRLSGDVNRLVKAGESRVFRWMPEPDDPDWTAAPGELSIVVKKWDPVSPPDYMVCDLVITNRQLYYVSTNAIPCGLAHERYKTGMMLFRKIPAAGVAFRMGSVSGESGREAEKEIPHYVTLTNDFYMALYETTLKQNYNIGGGMPTGYRNPNTWTNCMLAAVNFDLGTPGNVRGTTLGASWPTNHAVDATSTIGKLRLHANDDRFDLPTEAQWEFAFRAGSPEKYGAAGVVLNDVAWTFSNTPQASGYWHPTCVVGLKRPNAYGLYDMLGNAMEMCLDWYSTGSTYSEGDPVIDPRGPNRIDNNVVFRGGDIRCGDYRYSLDFCRAASRRGFNFKPDTSFGAGYRLIRFIGPLPGPFITSSVD